MSRFFIWLSGADRDLLDKSTNAPRTERIRFGGLGSLVLIPAVLAFFSMTYALSTIVESPWIYVGAGLIWGGMILAIDRYLVSTIYKTSLKGGNGRLWAILARYVFALLVGFAVAHPMVLLWFDDSISQQLAENRRLAVAERLDTAVAEAQVILSAPFADLAALSGEDTDPGGDGTGRVGVAAAAEEVALGVEAISLRLEERISRRNCLQNLQTAEQSGIGVELPCGFSSGLPTCGRRCAIIGDQIRDLQIEVAELEASLNIQLGALVDAERQQRDFEEQQREFDRVQQEFRREFELEQQIAAADRVEGERQARLEQIAAIDRQALLDVDEITAQFSDDYLARVAALSQLAAADGVVNNVTLFIFALIVFVDVLPITMKLATPMGEYEHIRDTQLEKREQKEIVERAIYTGDFLAASLRQLKDGFEDHDPG